MIKPGNVLNIPEWQVPGKKQGPEEVLITTTIQLVKTRDLFESYEETWQSTYSIKLPDFRPSTIKRKTTDTLEDALSSVVSLSASSKEVGKKFVNFPRILNFLVKGEKADEAQEGWSGTAKNVVEEIRKLWTHACDEI